MTQFEVGDDVAIWGSRSGDTVVTRAKIERETKLYWIAGGRKFRKSDGVEPGHQDTWTVPARLRRSDEEEVLRAEADQHRKRALSLLRLSMDALVMSPRSKSLAAEVIVRAQTYQSLIT